MFEPSAAYTQVGLTSRDEAAPNRVGRWGTALGLRCGLGLESTIASASGELGSAFAIGAETGLESRLGVGSGLVPGFESGVRFALAGIAQCTESAWAEVRVIFEVRCGVPFARTEWPCLSEPQ